MLSSFGSIDLAFLIFSVFYEKGCLSSRGVMRLGASLAPLDYDYYLTEIAFLILKVFNSPYTDETIINNLRVMKVSKYDKELAKIYALPLEAYKWIMLNRMKPDRAKASVKRYVKNVIQRNNEKLSQMQKNDV